MGTSDAGAGSGGAWGGAQQGVSGFLDDPTEDGADALVNQALQALDKDTQEHESDGNGVDTLPAIAPEASTLPGLRVRARSGSGGGFGVSRGGGGGGGGRRRTGGGGGRSSRQAARAGSRALAAGYALQRRDQAALAALGLNLIELEGLGPEEQINQILNVTMPATGSPLEAETRLAADSALIAIIKDGETDPEKVVRVLVVEFVFETTAAEYGPKFRDGSGRPEATLKEGERLLRRSITALVDKVEVKDGSLSPGDLEQAINDVIDEVREIAGGLSKHRLRISNSDTVPVLTTDDFLWRPRPLNSSFYTSIGPRAELLGALDELYIDFISIATLVYLVDLTVPRGRRGAERDLDIQVPVSDPGHWRDFAEAFEDLLRFLTGDYWTIRFVARRGGRGGDPREPDLTQSTSLLSGGADSFSGAVICGQDGPLTLVSHYSAKGAKPIQERLADALAAEWGNGPEHLQVTIGRRNEQLGSSAEFPREDSSRSRSILFIALGLAVASVRGGELTMAENGFAALNIPLSPERRGSLSTRTTHPAFLAGLNGVLRDAGLSVEVRNPFADLTKGQLFEQVKGILGESKASQLLSETHSCAKSNMFRFGQGLGPMSHCGVCFGCVVRRGAFIAAGLNDGTVYANEVLTGDPSNRFFAGGRLATWESVQYAVDRGFTARDIRAISPPPGHDIAAATTLANAGLEELAAVNISHP